ncbi:MAG: nuclear transport factor 2 family protein [Myxococcota bacterium]|nr:nuclear transport factor 2 family protein [Myxococcota bacterium]
MGNELPNTVAGSLTREAMGIEDGIALEASSGGIEELRADIQRLMDIEAIKQVKHTYFRCLDTANFEELATLFHPDVKVHFIGGTYEWTLQGKDEYVASVSQSFHRESIGHHNGHQPEIRLLSTTDATGVWYLTDNMWMLNHNFHTTGTAIYWDRYVKEEGRWLIKDTNYRRIYEINSQTDIRPQLSTHYLGASGSEVTI